MTSTVYTKTNLMPDSAQVKAARRRQEWVSKGIVYALLISGTLIFVLPLVVMVSTSLKSYNEINHYPPYSCNALLLFPC